MPISKILTSSYATLDATKLSVNNTYFTPVKKRTSIGDSSRSRPKNKSTRRLHKRTRGQGNHNATRTWINS